MLEMIERKLETIERKDAHHNAHPVSDVVVLGNAFKIIERRLIKI